MTDPYGDPNLIAHMDRQQVELDAEALRMIAFRESIHTMPGPLGIFFRAVGHAHDDYEEARRYYATTEGEPARWMPVVDEAVALWEYLRDGGAL